MSCSWSSGQNGSLVDLVNRALRIDKCTIYHLYTHLTVRLWTLLSRVLSNIDGSQSSTICGVRDL